MVVTKKKNTSTSSSKSTTKKSTKQKSPPKRSTTKKQITKKSSVKTDYKKSTGKTSKKSTARTSKKSTSRTSKRSVKRASKKGMNDVSNLSGKDASARLQEIELSAKSLNQQMDDVVGLPPLPGNEFNPEFHSHESLKQHKADFFEKILNGPDKKKESKKDKNTAIVDELTKKATAGTLSNIEQFDSQKFNADLAESGASASEQNEMKKELKDLDSFEKSLATPDEFKKEEPHKREIPLKLETPAETGGKKSFGSKEKSKENSKENKPLELPPANNAFKLEKKKGFFGKLFGSKSKQSHDLSKKYTAEDVKELHSLKDIPDSTSEIVDDKTITAIAREETPKTNSTKKDSVKDTIPEAKTNVIARKDTLQKDEKKSSVVMDKPEMPEKNAPKDESDVLTDTPDVLKNAQVDVDKKQQTSAESSTEKPETEELGTREYATGFVSDAIEGEMSTRSEPSTKAEQVVNDATSDDEETPQDIQRSKLMNVSISKLDAKRKRLESDVAELETKLKRSRADYEDKTVKLDKKERELDKREHDLDERENILLTLQTDLIRERKELDNREFQLFMSKERKEPSEKPTIRVSLEEKNLPQGLTDERLKIEQLMNQTRTLAINMKYDEAKQSYNRVVQVFHGTQLEPNDRQMLHLSIKELYHDISMLMNSSSEQNGRRMQ